MALLRPRCGGIYVSRCYAVAVGTAHFKDSIASKHIADALPQELEKLGIEDINELVGQVKFN